MTETKFSTARSQGSGGQHVNKVETKVVLTWNLNTSKVLSEEQKAMVREKIPHRISNDGNIQVVSQKYRSQHRNKELAKQKLIDLIIFALTPVKKRKPRKISRKQQEKRLEQKKRRSELKSSRKKYRH